MKRESKQYCTCFPEDIEGLYIGSICRNHDQAIGMRGTYNPLTPHIQFYKDLESVGVSLKWRLLITLGGTLFSWVKYPYFAYKIYSYRRYK